MLFCLKHFISTNQQNIWEKIHLQKTLIEAPLFTEEDSFPIIRGKKTVVFFGDLMISPAV